MAYEDDLVESAKIHGSAQHAHVLLAIYGILRVHRFVAEKCFVTNAFALPHVVDGDAQIHGFVDQYELPAGKLIHEAPTVWMVLVGLKE